MKHLNTGIQYRLNTTGLKARNLGFYTVESEGDNPLLYVLGDGEVVFVNSGGAIRITLIDAMKLCEDLPEIINEFKVYTRTNKVKESMSKLFEKEKDYELSANT